MSLPERLYDVMRAVEERGNSFRRHSDEFTPIIYFDHRPVSVLNLGLTRQNIHTEISRIVSRRNPDHVIVITTGYISRVKPNADGSPVDPLDRPLPHEDPMADEYLWIRGYERGELQMIQAAARISRIVGEPPMLTEWSVVVVPASGSYLPAIRAGWNLV